MYLFIPYPLQDAMRVAIFRNSSDKGGYGTIVVSRRGLSKVRQFFMGCVSMKVIQLARKHAVWVMS